MKNIRIFDDLVCPKCHSFLSHDHNKLICSSCRKDYPVINDTPDFRDRAGYWCNVSREKMQELNRLADISGDWLGTAKKTVPQYMDHFVSFNRADSQFLWPCTKDSKILDAGSMWGGIAVPAAQFHSEVYAVDKTVETLEFLRIRAQQMGFSNIHTVASGLEKLPFADDFFDLVVLSGVLEWVALEEEVVLERHWKKFGRGLRAEKALRYSEDPKTIQLRVLREIRRVIKPGGCIYLAIENRIGYIYLAGYPDDHMNIPFISFMPRSIANLLTKLILKREYRTHVHGIPGYRSLLKESGFRNIDFYGAFMHYITPSEVIPLDLIKNLKKEISSTKGILNRILLRFLPKGLLKWLSPSIIAIAVKGSSIANNEPRLIKLLRLAGLITNESSNVKIVKCDSRPGNDLTVNYWVYSDNKNRPRYFCKVCRNRESIDILDAESKNLKRVDFLLKDTRLVSNIPKLLYYGTIDDVTFMVTEFVEAKNSVFTFNDRLKTKLEYLDREIKMAIRFLASFQKHTIKTQVESTPYLISFLEDQKKILEKHSLLTEDAKKSIGGLKEELCRLKNFTIPLCAQHGDYDFCNTLFTKNELKIVDFEHFQEGCLPFLDLATLIFNPILVSSERKKNTLPLCVLLDRYNLTKYITSWISLYAELTGIPKQILRLVPPLAALEQRTKEYAYYRNPETFPINGAFEEFLRSRISF